MLVFASKVHNLRHLGLGHLVRIDAAFADAMLMHVHHDSVGAPVVLVEEALEHMDHELHRRVIVVQQQHAVEIGPLGLRLGLGDDRGARRARPSPFAVVVIALTRGTRSICGACIHRGWSSAHGYFTGQDVAALGRKNSGPSMLHNKDVAAPVPDCHIPAIRREFRRILFCKTRAGPPVAVQSTDSNADNSGQIRRKPLMP